MALVLECWCGLLCCCTRLSAGLKVLLPKSRLVVLYGAQKGVYHSSTRRDTLQLQSEIFIS